MADESDQELMERLLREERLRAQVAARLAAEAEQAKPKPKSFLSENFKWIVVTLLIPLVTAIYGSYQARVAEIRAASEQEIAKAERAQEALLTDARNDVTSMTALLPALSDPDPRKSELALVILGRLEAAQHGVGDQKIHAVYAEIQAKIKERQNSKDPAQANLGARQAEALQKAGGNTQQLNAEVIGKATAAASVPSVRPDRVYVQVFTAAQKAQAQRAQEGLRNLGVAVPGVENVGGKIAKGTLPGWEIRYFSDADLGAALWAKQHLAELGFDKFQVYRARAATRVPAGQVELWWPNTRDR